MMKETSGFWTRLFTALVTLSGVAFGATTLFLAWRLYDRVGTAFSLGLLVDTGSDLLAVAKTLGAQALGLLLIGGGVLALTLLLYFGHLYLLTMRAKGPRADMAGKGSPSKSDEA